MNEKKEISFIIKSFFLIFFNIGLIILIALILALPLTILWNWVIPSLTGLKQISYFQSIALLIISRILFPPTWFSTLGKKPKGGKKVDWKESFFGRLGEFGKREKDPH